MPPPSLWVVVLGCPVLRCLPRAKRLHQTDLVGQGLSPVLFLVYRGREGIGVRDAVRGSIGSGPKSLDPFWNSQSATEGSPLGPLRRWTLVGSGCVGLDPAGRRWVCRPGPSLFEGRGHRGGVGDAFCVGPTAGALGPRPQQVVTCTSLRKTTFETINQRNSLTEPSF